MKMNWRIMMMSKRLASVEGIGGWALKVTSAKNLQNYYEVFLSVYCRCSQSKDCYMLTLHLQTMCSELANIAINAHVDCSKVTLSLDLIFPSRECLLCKTQPSLCFVMKILA